MKLATITNWAYASTVALTLVSGAAMLFASSAHEVERSAVKQRFVLDNATSRLESELYVLTGQVRQYVIDGDPAHLIVYERETTRLKSIGQRIDRIGDAGASVSELSDLEEALRWSETLQVEQRAAIEAHRTGDQETARKIIFGGEYERELQRARNLFERFQSQLNQRTAAAIEKAEDTARLWRTVSEIALAMTAFAFFCVLFFLFKRRVLRPVTKLSDVISRLAQQDFAVQPPMIDQVDEIGDMAQAITVFRENGLERQRLERELSADVATRELLARMTQRMQSCENQTELADVVEQFMPKVSPSLAGRLYLLDNQRRKLIEICSWGAPSLSRMEFEPVNCWALRRGVTHSPAYRKDIPCEHLETLSGVTANTICIPLTAQRETLGLLYIELDESIDADQQDKLMPYIDMLAENISLALANLNLRVQLRDMALSDVLTGLPNRRAFDLAMKRELAAAEDDGLPLSCLIVDVDHFKRFNDDYGHEAGDAVLAALGKVLSNATREQGMAFRYGGEEFVLLMPGLNSAQAQERGEQIRASVSGISLVHENKSLGKITVSTGLACFPDHCPGSALVRMADMALLRAKELGRNRVEAAGSVAWRTGDAASAHLREDLQVTKDTG